MVRRNYFWPVSSLTGSLTQQLVGFQLTSGLFCSFKYPLGFVKTFFFLPFVEEFFFFFFFFYSQTFAFILILQRLTFKIYMPTVKQESSCVHLLCVEYYCTVLVLIICCHSIVLLQPRPNMSFSGEPGVQV